jgi:hypothetical protein
VTCPAGGHRDAVGTAGFGSACAGCPGRAQCSTAAGRCTVAIRAHQNVLARAPRPRKTDAGWQTLYQAKVVRKLEDLVRHHHRARARAHISKRLLDTTSYLGHERIEGSHSVIKSLYSKLTTLHRFQCFLK